MKITIQVDEHLSEDVGDFRVRQLTPELSKLLAQLQNLDFKLIATKDEKKYQLDLAKITTIYADNKKVYASLDDRTEFALTQSLSALTEKLPSNFLRISNSEIVNASKITHFEFTFGGKIKIHFKNGGFTYSGRSYLKDFKRYFGL